MLISKDGRHFNLRRMLMNHKAYVQGWIQAIKEKPETLIKAIREAEKTANYMDSMAEIINEKEYHATKNESIEVSEKDILTENKEQIIEPIP
jgi:antirestriction protein ArdC